MKTITLTMKEQNRAAILSKLAKKSGKGTPTIPELAEVLGLCERQVYRLKTRYREKGAQGLAHGNRGRESPRKTPKEIKDKIVKMATGTYQGFNDHHLTEKLNEVEGIVVSRSTVQRTLRAGREALSRESFIKKPKVTQGRFFLIKKTGRDFIGGIIDQSQKGQTGSPTLQPIMVGAVGLQHHPFLCFSLPARAMLGPSFFSNRRNPAGSERSLHGRPGNKNVFHLIQLFCQMMVIESLICTGRHLHAFIFFLLGCFTLGLSPPIAMGQSLGTLLSVPGL